MKLDLLILMGNFQFAQGVNSLQDRVNPIHRA